MFTQERKDKIRAKALERAKIKSPISNILNSPTWEANHVLKRQEKGTYKRPHKRNRKMLEIPDAKFTSLVLEHGVLGLARVLSCSQSAIRDRSKKLGIILKYGPRPVMTVTTKYRDQARKQRMTQKFPLRGTSIELELWAELERRGIQFEKHKSIIGRTQPDAFIAPNICLYADGDYWHNREDVKAKDLRINSLLLANNYKIYRFWEHEIHNDVASCVSKIK